MVFGAGPVGLLVAAMCKNAGASHVLVADLDAGRVQFARENAFADIGHVVINRAPRTTEERLEAARRNADELKHAGAFGEADVSFDCTGAPASVQTAICVG